MRRCTVNSSGVYKKRRQSMPYIRINHKAGKQQLAGSFFPLFCEEKLQKSPLNFGLTQAALSDKIKGLKYSSVHRKSTLLTSCGLRSAESRGGLIVALRGSILTIHKLLPPFSDIEQNQLWIIEQTNLMFFCSANSFRTRQNGGRSRPRQEGESAQVESRKMSLVEFEP